MNLTDIMDERAVLLNVTETDKDKVLSRLIDALEKTGNVNDKAEVEKAILARERLMSTGVGSGIAIPHAKTDAVDKISIAFAVSKNGIKFKAVDKKDVHVIFMLVVPKDAAAENLKVLTMIAKILRGNTSLITKLISGNSPAEIISLLKEEEESV